MIKIKNGDGTTSIRYQSIEEMPKVTFIPELKCEGESVDEIYLVVEDNINRLIVRRQRSTSKIITTQLVARSSVNFI